MFRLFLPFLPPEIVPPPSPARRSGSSLKVPARGCQWALTCKWTVDEQRAGMRAAEAPRPLSLQEGPRCAATCPRTSVCSPSSSPWHPGLRSSPLPPRLSCTLAGVEGWGGGASRLSPAWHFDVSSVIVCGLWQLSLEGFDMKSRLSSQVYATASDPGLKQSAPSPWDTVTTERLAPHRGFLSHEGPLLLVPPPQLWTRFRSVD